ncbi:MAG: outer membrane protein transport protein [Pseudomonadota bacterium]
MDTRRFTALATALSAAALVSASAHAGSFAIKERSTRAQGLSFAGATAGSGGLQSMGFNPAAIGVIDPGAGNVEISGGVSVINPNTEGQASVNGVPVGGPFDAGRLAGLANSYIGFRLEDDILLGMAIYTPFGLTTQYDAGWLGQFDALTSSLQTITFAPTIAYEPMPGLTLALSGNLMYTSVRLTTAAGQLDGDTTVPSFSVGAMWQATPSTTVGLAYLHGYNIQVDGFFTPTGGVPLPARAAAQLPGVVSLGVVQGITSDFRVMGEVQWQNWSTFDKLDVALIGGPALQSDTQGYEDAFYIAAGAEYDINDQFTVRTGVGWDQTPTNSGTPVGVFPAAVNPIATNRTARVPDEDRLWLSIGASYAMNDHMSIDVGYSYLFALEDSVVGLRNAPAGSVAIYEGSAHIFSIGGSMKF